MRQSEELDIPVQLGRCLPILVEYVLVRFSINIVITIIWSSIHVAYEPFQSRAKKFLGNLVFDEADFIMYRLKYSNYKPTIVAHKLFRKRKEIAEETGTVYSVGAPEGHRKDLLRIVWNTLEREYGPLKSASGAEHFGEPTIEIEDEDICFIQIDGLLEVVSHVIYKTGYLWKYTNYYDHQIRLNRN